MKKLLIFSALMLINIFVSAQTLTSSNLPIVIITTDYYPNTTIHQDILDDPKIGADMKIIYHTDGSRNYVSDQSNALLLNYDGRIEIEIRGSTSQWEAKKPYSINTIKSDKVTSNNVSILNMPKENDWMLNSFAHDPSFMRDFLCYDLSRTLGNYACRGKHCEVMINGVYVGVYLFSENIKVDGNRVDIAKMKTTDVTGVDVTGGYITKCDKPTGGDVASWSYTTRAFSWVDFMHEFPKPTDIQPQQDQYIHDQFDALQNALNNHNASVANGYPSIIDIPSFIDFMIVNELAANVDAYQFSTFFHKDKGGKLRAGPVWDFNLSFGIDVFGGRSTTYDFQFDNGDNVGADFWKDLYDDPTFHCYFVKRWQELTAANHPLNYATIEHKIDSLATLLAESKVREEATWGTIGAVDNSTSDLKSWLNTRMNWLNQNLTSSGCQFPAVAPIVISKINYNPLLSAPYTSNDLEFIELTNNSASTINLSGYYLKELGVSYVFPNNSTIPANGKIYLAGNSAAFSAHYSKTAYGEYSRELSNSSEKLILCDAFGNIADYVEYGSTAPWPTAADGTGAYLILKGLNLDNALASSWIAATSGNTNTEEIAEVHNTIIYPNPSRNLLTIQSDLQISKYEIYDELGRLILTENSVQSNKVSANVENLSTNTYIVKITLENQSVVYQKLTKCD